MTTRSLRTAALAALTVAVAATVAGAALSAVAATNAEERSSATGASRILYSSDWAGPTQIYAVDAVGRATGQVTFGRAPSRCRSWAEAYGFAHPVPSPDGAWVLYRTTCGPDVWLARVDGTAARQLSGSPEPYLIAQPLSEVSSWSPDSRRVAYSDGRTTYVVEVPSMRTRPIRNGLAWYLDWSSDNKTLAMRTSGEVVLWRAGARRTVDEGTMLGPGELGLTGGRGRLGWSADGRWLAYRLEGKIVIVGRTGSGRRVLGKGGWLAWSPSRPQLAFVADDRVVLYDPVRQSRRRLAPITGRDLAWAPDGQRLALLTPVGVRAIEVADGRSRLLTGRDATGFEWGPDARGIAFLATHDGQPGPDLRIADLAGRARTVLAGDGVSGGRISSFAWVTPPSGTRFRAPAPVGGVYAGGPVSALAADGSSVAVVVCGRVYLSESASPARRLDDRPADCNPNSQRANVPQVLAMAGRQVVYQVADVGLGYTWQLMLASPGLPSGRIRLDSGSGNLGGPTNSAAGSGSLLVYSTWPRFCSPDECPDGAWQELRRVLPDGTSVRVAREPVTAAGEMPIDPLDVDGDRILTQRAFGPSGIAPSLSIWGVDGRKRLLLYVDAAAASLSGDDLVVQASDATLRVYDAATGALRRQWPLDGLLQDTSRGLAATVADDRVRLIRLADGTKRDIGYGTLARFNDQGLVVADGTRVRLVDFASLQGV